ncbi:MAG: hypothetical protein HY293_19735 [Planctomycetes bacterium]|nr:hypothetical protein [Planctomycetota bacterium]
MSEAQEPTTSNAFRLTGRQWIGLLLFAVALYVLTPLAWQRAEKLETGPDYRIPFELSSDYWLWGRVAAQQVAAHDTLILVDSVVWGVFVKPGETLSHYLNALEGRDRYANLGVNGKQPVALAGLIEHYGSAIKGKEVILHCNPLWMSYPKHDLRDKDDPGVFADWELAPQFSPLIPSYKESTSNRIGKVIDRNVPFHAWTSHLQYAYFGEGDVPRTVPMWTLDHPYENPLKVVTCKLPPPSEELRKEPVAWSTRIPRENMPWVDLAGSLQWKSFLRAVELLQKRGNTVKVVVGPFNEHLLKDPSRVKYSELKQSIEAALKERKIPYIAPEPLPSEQYGDASHPLSAGYALLAKQLVAGGFLAAAEAPK